MAIVRAARVLVAALIAVGLSGSPAMASPLDLRLGPGGMWSSSPPGMGSARLVPSLSLAGGLRVGYSQEPRDPRSAGTFAAIGKSAETDRELDGQVQLAVGLFDWIEISGSIAGRLELPGLASGSDDSSPPVRAAALPFDVQLKLAIPGLRPATDGPGIAAALALDLRIPLDAGERLAWRPSFIVEHRTGWGLLGACELGAEVRAADDAEARPFSVSIDLGLGGSLTLVERWALALIASGRTRIPLAPLPADAAAVAWTASGGLTFGSPGEGFFRVEAGIASPGLTSDIANAGWFTSLSALWTPGRAASIGGRRAGEILDEPQPAGATECDVLSAAADPPPMADGQSPPAPPRDLLAAPFPPSATGAWPSQSSPSPPAPKPARRPCLTPRQTDIYVDFFAKADYQLDRGTKPGTGLSSTLLHLTFADGTEIDVDFREIDENTVDTPTFRRQVHNAHVGPGGRLFPERMNRRTTPRLWEEKHKALVIIDEETLGFIDLGLTGVMTVLPIPAGGLHPAPGSAAPRSRLRSANRPTATSPKPRAGTGQPPAGTGSSSKSRPGAGQPPAEPRAVKPDELQIHVAPDRELPGGVAGDARAGKPAAPGRTPENTDKAGSEMAPASTDTRGGGRRAFSAKDRERAFEAAKDENAVPRCEYCGTELQKEPGSPRSYEADHRLPHSRGGPSSKENLAPACRSCNRSKGAKTPGEWKPRR